MFTQITTELDLLVVAIEKEIEFVDALRQNEHNSNVYIEDGGRLVGLTEALAEVRQTQLKINEHIIEILKNTTDGNYVAKMGVLEKKNEVLTQEISLLQQELKRYKTKPVDSECFREFSSEEIDQKILDKYEEDCDIVYEDDEGEDDSEENEE